MERLEEQRDSARLDADAGIADLEDDGDALVVDVGLGDGKCDRAGRGELGRVREQIAASLQRSVNRMQDDAPEDLTQARSVANERSLVSERLLLVVLEALAPGDVREDARIGESVHEEKGLLVEFLREA